jgi:mannose-6-phosphate isomerase-like protein (cupin superfamily)
MDMRIRVTTRANLFEERKQQHIERGYRIEDERPIPANGFSSFIAVSEISDSDGIGDIVAQALRGELAEISLPPGSSIAYDVSPLPGLEHHLWMLEGALSVEIDAVRFQLQKGDCVRYVLSGPSRFLCAGKRTARYLISLIHP